MAIFQKKHDPILEHESRLKSQLAEVEAHIRKLDADLRRQAAAEPKVRSTTRPGAAGPSAPAPENADPGLEDLRPQSATNPFDASGSAARLNARGVARFDLAGTVRGWIARLRGKPCRNPRLVTYLAAGSIQGLPALRYERRVARNRFFIICGVLVVVFLGVFYWWPEGR